jgi:hypothetical protein
VPPLVPGGQRAREIHAPACHVGCRVRDHPGYDQDRFSTTQIHQRRGIYIMPALEARRRPPGGPSRPLLGFRGPR